MVRDDVMSSLSGWPVGERERERGGGMVISVVVTVFPLCRPTQRMNCAERFMPGSQSTARGKVAIEKTESR